MKQRFSSIDVKVIAHELSNALVTLRVSNIYDLSSKIFLIKFAKPDNKQQILIDSGFRCHLTDFSRATAAAPSVFVQRLRKYLKTRRVTQVSQIGTDRIIEFQFSDGQYRLYLEFYAGGNIILTDKDLNILTLLRVVDPGEAQEELRVGLKYSLDNRQNYGGIPDLTKERLQEALQKGVDKGEDDSGKKKKKPGDALRKALAVSITEFPPMLVDHAMRITNFNSSLKPAEVLQSEDLLDHLMKSLQEAQRVVQEITSSETAKGYIVAKKKDSETTPSDESQTDIRKGLLYDDFHPFKPKQFQDDPSLVFLEFEGFNKTVDEFFSSIEGQKLESKLEEREKQAQKKIQAARNEQAKRLGGLQEIQALNERKAGALQANVERVQEVTDAVNGLIAQGMDWFEIGRLIEREQKFDNPVASMIKLPLKLEENTVTILLNEEAFDEDEDSTYETDSDVSESEDEDNTVKTNKKKEKVADTRIPIDIDLALSPWANARNYFDQKRSAASKEDKTLQSSSKALKSTEAKIAQDLKKGLKQEKAILRPVRKQMWFEKFIWFISSDGYLVLAGKDAQQSEILYKRYLKKGDIYLHADIRGAASVIVRNNPKTPDAPIPPQTLSQAGTLVVVTSSAWDSKAGMSAWWVTADQVSKSAPPGEFLPAGSFNTHGKKNFLPPAQLLLGFGVLFQISDESKARHVKHRLQDDSPSGGTTTDALPAGDPLLDDEGSGDELNQSDADEPSATKEVEADHQDVDDSDDEDADSKPNPLQGETEPDEVATQEKLENLQIDDKKPQPSESEVQVEESDEDSVEESQSQPITTGKKATPVQNPPKKGPAPAKRGKKGKAKKIAQKYKDQDEEDRIAAQEIIGAAAGQEKAEAEAKAKAAREAELAFQKERRRAQHQRTQKETAEHEEMRKLMLEDGIDTHEDNEIETMTSLDSFVGLPLPGDEILEAIPVCAPWAAMGKYKYKAKIQPGAQKKGKAVREILGKWMAASTAKGVLDESSMDVERIWPREMDLIKGWKPEETTNVVPVGKVRVMMGGGSAAAKAKGDKGKSSGGRGGRGSKKK
ncbi:hypothetical protein BTUL_0011g01070 [Botrytis tulipae]|uniref:Ribosome quality control complex subunit 2 n=1 Tax=Botrytis tulipae TaxID=87230 RepID=A0A4Z1F3M5_9HELO|nr:hypothetical protein BTUL_0011g01070 [Botrytis tulipae]